MNARTGSPGTHYAISNASGSTTGFSSDYNFLANATTSTLGSWAGTSVTFATWKSDQSATSGDSHSTTAQAASSGTSSYPTTVTPDIWNNNVSPPVFDINLSSSAYQYVLSSGTSVAPTVTTDIHGTTRAVSPNQPTIGSDEIPSCSGYPGVATVHASPSSLCGGSGTSALSLSGVAPSSGFSYRWFSSTTSNSGPWSIAAERPPAAPTPLQLSMLPRGIIAILFAQEILHLPLWTLL